MADSTVANEYGLVPRGGGALEVNRPRHLALSIGAVKRQILPVT